MNLNSIFHLVASITIIIFCIFVFIKNKKNVYFVFFGVAIFVWLFASFFAYISQIESQALFWFKISYIGVAFIPPTFFHFVFNLLGRKPNKIISLNYIISLCFIFLLYSSGYFIKGLYKYSWGYYPKASFIGHPLFLLFFNILFSASIILIFLSFHSKTSKLSVSDKNRLKYLFIGNIIGALGALDFLPNYGINIYPLGFIFMMVFPSIYTYAILRYRLMDIQVVFKRTMAYSLSVGLLTAFFVFLVITVTNLLSSYAHVSSFTVSIFAVIIIALLFNPLRNKIQKIIDKLFYKKTYDYYGTLQKVSHDLAAMFDLKKIYSFIGDTIFSALGLRSIYLISAGPGGDYEVVYQMLYDEKKRDKKTPKIDGDCFMVKSLRTSEDIVIKDELPALVDLLGQETIDCITTNLELFDGEAVMPVVGDGKPSLLMILGGKLSGDIFTNEDINFLKTVSNQIAIAIKNAKLYSDKLHSEKFASIGMMSATFAHEIRNPLTSIKTFTQLFPEKFDDAEFRNIFSKIVIDDIGRIDGLIKDLLSFSSKESVPGINTLDITELVNGVLEHQKGRFEFEKNNISLRKKYKDARINILGDPQKLKRALINIISNGCQAMQENGVLTVDIMPNSKEVDIKISDTGKGMSSQEMAKIFDPFYTTKAMGMGLGLAISKKIIEDQGGRIAVESKLSQGTTFTISLQVEKKSDN